MGRPPAEKIRPNDKSSRMSGKNSHLGVGFGAPINIDRLGWLAFVDELRIAGKQVIG